VCWTYPAGRRTGGRWNGSANICSRSRTRAPGFAAGGFFVHRTHHRQLGADEFALVWKDNIISNKVARENGGVVSAAWWARKPSHIAEGSLAQTASS
jgi:hypothetical protein